MQRHEVYTYEPVRHNTKKNKRTIVTINLSNYDVHWLKQLTNKRQKKNEQLTGVKQRRKLNGIKINN